jgi:type I restriction enzyme S subunit
MTGRLPKGWKQDRLDAVAELERSTVVPQDIREGTKYVGLEHIESSGAFLDVPEVETGELASNKFAFTDQHVLYGKLRPYLTKIARPDFSGVCSTEIIPIRTNGRIIRDYLYYYLRQPSMVALANARTAGANLPRLSPTDLASFPITYPEVPSEQRRIADILNEADALRRKRAEAIQLANDLVPSIFDGMFGGSVTKSKKWPVVELGDLFAIPPNYGTMIPPAESGEWLDLRVINIQDGELELTDRKYVYLPAGMISRHEVRDGDLLLARAIGSRQHLGKCFIARPGSEKWAFDSHLMRVRFDVDQVLPDYVHAYLTSHVGRAEFLRNTRRSAVQYNINTKEMARIRIPKPPHTVQEEFLDRAHAVQEVAQRQRESRCELDNLIHSLLQRAFRGEL